MLSRIAESCYWIGHLVERADYTARLLDVHYHNLLQSHPSESQRLSRHLANVMGVENSENFTNVEETMSYIGLNEDFGGSIVTSMNNLSINAKAVQDTIPTELFEVIYSTNKALHEKIENKNSAHSLYKWVRDRTMQIHGVIDASLVRDDCYHFLNIGRCIERIDMTARMVSIRCAMSKDSSAWITMLRSCGAFEGYMRTHGDLSDTNSLIEFLLRNTTFPRSILSSASNALSSVQALKEDPTVGNDFSNEREPKFILGRFCAEIEFTSIEDVANNLDEEVNKLSRAANAISNSISSTYFQVSTAINWRQ